MSKFSRRQILAGAASSLLLPKRAKASFCGNTIVRGSPLLSVPPGAQAWGMTQRVFSDDFTNAGTIDFNNTLASGFNWYIKPPFNYPSYSPSNFSVANSLITVSGGPGNSAIALVTAAPKAGTPKGWVGQAFRNGFYIEGRMSVLTRNVGNWGGFWSMAVEHCYEGDPLANTEFAEYDFIEDDIGGTSYGGAVHDWNANVGTSNYNASNFIIGGLSDATSSTVPFHIFGALWVPMAHSGDNTGRAFYYLDNVLTSDQTTWTSSSYTTFPASQGQANFFSIIDQCGMPIFFGNQQNAGGNSVIAIDWINVWQNPNYGTIESY